MHVTKIKQRPGGNINFEKPKLYLTYYIVEKIYPLQEYTLTVLLVAE
jgi:hypothetical protein